MPEVRLDLSDPSSQLVEVQIRVQPRLGPLLLSLPAWTPGSYLIRDYVRHLERLRVYQGHRELPLERLGPAQWRVPLELAPDRPEAAGAEPVAAEPGAADAPAVDASVAAAEPITISYAILATELTVRTCHLNGDHGFLALAAVVLQVQGERWSPHQLDLVLPPHWQPFVPLPPEAEGRWLARDYDQLVDSPVEAGPHPSHRFAGGW